ncbi:MAG: TetR/AcrR family transcriptional regulator [Actinomycetota bacterium]
MAKAQVKVPTRDRILGATADLLRRKGYTGTGLKEIVRASEAPFGSVYHFFPGGKEELGAEAIRLSGKTYNALIQAFYEGARDLVSATGEFFEGAAQVLRETNYEDACPIATVALEVASASEPMREATAEVFESWIADCSSYFVGAGLDASRAREVSITLFNLIEGAFILCRAWKSTEPMKLAGELAVAVVRDAVGTASKPNPRHRAGSRSAR